MMNTFHLFHIQLFQLITHRELKVIKHYKVLICGLINTLSLMNWCEVQTKEFYGNIIDEVQQDGRLNKVRKKTSKLTVFFIQSFSFTGKKKRKTPNLCIMK